MVKLKDLNSRLKGRPELKDEEIAAECRKNHESITSDELQISSLQFQTEQVDTIQNRRNEEAEKMAASLEAEKQKVSEQH